MNKWALTWAERVDECLSTQMKQWQSAVREQAGEGSTAVSRCMLEVGWVITSGLLPWLALWWDCGAASGNTIATHLITNDIRPPRCQFVSIIIILGNVSGISMRKLIFKNNYRASRGDFVIFLKTWLPQDTIVSLPVFIVPSCTVCWVEDVCKAWSKLWDRPDIHLILSV